MGRNHYLQNPATIYHIYCALLYIILLCCEFLLYIILLLLRVNLLWCI